MRPTGTLASAKKQLIRFFRRGEANAWKIGNLLNEIERSGLARARYGKTRRWLDSQVPGAKEKTTTLYRYAELASVYSSEQFQRWKISRLEYLMTHDKSTVGRVVAEDPANREVQLLQTDGSCLTKKFCDCTSTELRLSNHLRNKAKRLPAAAAVLPPSRSSPITKAFALLMLGSLLMGGSRLAPSNSVAWWLSLFALGVLLSGIGMWIQSRQRGQSSTSACAEATTKSAHPIFT